MKITGLHYVPVLRCKGAEQKALQNLSSPVRSAMVPLIEFVPKDFFEEAKQGAMVKVSRRLIDSCGWHYPFIIDPGLLGDEIAANCVRPIFAQVIRYNADVGIVTGVSRSSVYQSAVEEVLRMGKSDLVLRLSAFEIRQAAVASMIDQTLAELSTTRRQTHLILDFGHISRSGINFSAWFGNIPSLAEWKSVTVLAGTFPKDLGEFARNEEHEFERGEWISWCELSLASSLPIAFGDYTVQHPFFEEHEGKGLNFSASIRYTTPNGWLVFRGESVRNPDGPGYQQYLGEAKLLCTRQEFSGKAFCWGDNFISDKGTTATDTGGPKEWLAAAINHHLTLVAGQIREGAVVAATGAQVNS
jgi:hypothetical protein